MSRMLRLLEADGLATVTPSDADARVRVARLTAQGLAERAILDERSDDLAASIIEPLDERQREELVAAMRTVERLIATSLVELRAVDPEEPNAQRCLRAYVAELNWCAGPRVRSKQGLDRQSVRGPATFRCVRRGLPARGADRLRARSSTTRDR